MNRITSRLYYYPEIYVDLERQYIAQMFINEYSPKQRNEIEFIERKKELTQLQRDEIEDSILPKLERGNKINYGLKEILIKANNLLDPNVKVFNEDLISDVKTSELIIEKYLKQLGEISFIHLLLGNMDGILGKFNSEKFIIDENRNLKSIYTTISIINVYLMLKEGIFDMKNGEDYVKLNNIEFRDRYLIQKKSILVEKLEKLINTSIKEFEETGEVLFVRKFINKDSSFIDKMKNELRNKGFGEKRIINEISKGFIAGMWNIIDNYNDSNMETILEKHTRNNDINGVEFNIIREFIIEIKEILSNHKMRAITKVEYNKEGKKIVTTYKNGIIFERKYYGVDIPSEIISTNGIDEEIRNNLTTGFIDKITTDKREEFIRKQVYYKGDSFSDKNNVPDIFGGLRDLIREGISTQLMNQFTQLIKSPNASYNVFYNDNDEKIAEVYLELVSNFKEFSIESYDNKDKKLLLSELVQIGETIFFDMIFGNTDRMISREFNGSNILIDSKGRFNAIDTTFSVMNMYLIWLFNEFNLMPSEEFINNNKKDLILTQDNTDKLLDKMINEIGKFIETYKNEEEEKTIFEKVINNLLFSFQTILDDRGITREQFTKAIYAGVMRGIEGVAKNYDSRTFPILDNKTLSGQELLVLQRVMKEITEEYYRREDGNKNGAYFKEYPDGSVEEVLIFINGERDSLYQKVFGPKVAVTIIGNFGAEGKRIGNWNWNRSEGKPIMKGEYNNKGDPVNEWKIFDNTGVEIFNMMFNKGKLESFEYKEGSEKRIEKNKIFLDKYKERIFFCIDNIDNMGELVNIINTEIITQQNQ